MIKAAERLLRDYPERKELCKQARLLLVPALDSEYRINDALKLIDEMRADDSYGAERKAGLLMTKAEIQYGAGRYADCKAVCQKALTDYATHEELPSRAKWLLIQVRLEDGSDPDAALAAIDEMRTSPFYEDKTYQAQLDMWSG